MENSKPTYQDRIDYLRDQTRKNIANGRLQENMLIHLHKVEETIYMKESLIRLMSYNNADRDRITAITIIELIEELMKDNTSTQKDIANNFGEIIIDEIKDQYGIERRKEDE